MLLNFTLHTMKFPNYVIFMLNPSFHLTDFRGAPKLSLIQERTANGAPSVSITFPDGHKDMLVMHRFFGNEEDRMANEEHCHYFGHLANEPEACVAMTGCVGSEDVEFTILSEHSHGSHILKWTTEGNVEIQVK